jgi:hypothetical protein
VLGVALSVALVWTVLMGSFNTSPTRRAFHLNWRIEIEHDLLSTVALAHERSYTSVVISSIDIIDTDIWYPQCPHIVDVWGIVESPLRSCAVEVFRHAWKSGVACSRLAWRCVS